MLMSHNSELTFLKLGGSLITDKRQPLTAQPAVIRRLAQEIAGVIHTRPDLQLIIGHGSGSYGHTIAEQYGTREGVHTPEDWLGFATVATIAARLNCMVTDALHDAGVPVLRIQPSASTHCDDGSIIEMALAPIRNAMESGLVPLVYGDAAFDATLGGTIISTEDIFGYLAAHLHPKRILLAGIVEGVFDRDGHVIPEITKKNFEVCENALGDSHGKDVTGGMLSKVKIMLALCEDIPGLETRIFSGVDAGMVRRLLIEPEWNIGTRIWSGHK